MVKDLGLKVFKVEVYSKKGKTLSTHKKGQKIMALKDTKFANTMARLLKI